MYLKIAFAILILCISYSTFAEKGDQDKPLDIQAEHCDFNQKTMVSTCRGHVVVTQGTMTIQSQKLVVSQDQKGNYFAQGAGRPVKFKQRMDNGIDWLEAQSYRFDYDGEKRRLQLLEQAWVRQGDNQVKGEKITYNLDKEEYEAIGKPGERVSITLIPKDKTGKSN